MVALAYVKNLHVDAGEGGLELVGGAAVAGLPADEDEQGAIALSLGEECVPVLADGGVASERGGDNAGAGGGWKLVATEEVVAAEGDTG